MSLTIVEIENESPTTSSSEGFVAYANIGPRPTCSTCDTVSDCGTCGSDGEFQVPVVAGDLIYLQFREVDEYNEDPQNPTIGWKNGAEDYWIEASLLFNDGSSLALNAGGTGYAASIIAGNEVGYFQGSYQTLILNSQRIEDYLNSLPNVQNCFKVVITTYKQQAESFLSILGFYATLPPTYVGDNQIAEGTIIWVVDQFYIIENGAWVTYETDATIIFNQKTGLYYQLSEGEWFEYEISFERVANTTCAKPTYRFSKCEMTIKVEGIHGESDCRGNYYGGEIGFRDRYRMWASFEITGYANDRTINEDDITTAFKSKEVYLLRLTKGTPFMFMEQFNNTLLANTVYIDDNVYINFSDLEKNNDNGYNWWSQITCERSFCEKTQNCVDEVYTNPLLICDEPNCPEVGEPVTLVGELGDYSSTAACGTVKEIPAATVEDTEGNVLGLVDAGETLVVDCSGGDPSGTCDPASVVNSDESFDESVPSGDTLVLEDYTVNLYLDEVLVDTETAPAMTDLEINVNWI